MNVSVLVSTFLAATIEVIEMVAIVVAVAVTRSRRVALLGALAGLVLLAILIGVLGTALRGVPLKPLRLVIGALLLAFGSQWLRKGIRLVSRDGWAKGIGEQRETDHDCDGPIVAEDVVDPEADERPCEAQKDHRPAPAVDGCSISTCGASSRRQADAARTRSSAETT